MLDPARKRFLIALCLIDGLVALDSTIVATALPKIVESLAGARDYTWVVTGYLISSSVVIPVTGRLVDLVAPRRLIFLGTLLFLGGSLLAGSAPGMSTLILARVIQGLGGGTVTAVSWAVLGLAFPPGERGPASALFGASLGLASAAGPFLGGLITDALSWHWIFFVNLPLGGLGWALLVYNMPSLNPESSQRMDWGGAVLLALWCVPLLLALSWGGSEVAWTSPLVMGLLVCSLIFSAAFAKVERGRPEALFDLSLFHNRAFLVSSTAFFLLGAAMMGGLLFLPLFLIQIANVSVTTSGLVMTPSFLGAVVGSVLTGRKLRESSPRPLLLVGNSLLCAGLLGLGLRLAPDTGLYEILAWSTLNGAGLGCLLPGYPVVVQNSVERVRMGTASSLLQFLRMLGGTMGAAFLGTLLVSGMDRAVPSQLNNHFQEFGLDITVSEYQDPQKLQQLFTQSEAELSSRLSNLRGGDPALLNYAKAVPQPLRDELVGLDKGAVVPPEWQKEAVASLSKQLGLLGAEVEKTGREALAKEIALLFRLCGLLTVLSLIATFFIGGGPLPQDEPQPEHGPSDLPEEAS